MRVVNLQTNEVHDVWKYLKSSDGQESVWCFDWYGHHVIGVDCEFEQTIEQRELLITFRRWLIENECADFGTDYFVVNEFLRDNKLQP